nr:MAG TPA: membrane protein [Caudoviricetes sp.]
MSTILLVILSPLIVVASYYLGYERGWIDRDRMR